MEKEKEEVEGKWNCPLDSSGFVASNITTEAPFLNGVKEEYETQTRTYYNVYSFLSFYSSWVQNPIV